MICGQTRKNVAGSAFFVGLVREKIKPWAYKAFVGKEKVQKQLKAKQRQQEQILLLLQAYLSFVVSFFFTGF